MHPLLRLAYSAAGGVARLLTRVAPADGSGGKLARSLGARRGVIDRFETWGHSTSGRDHARPLLWMHAPSVGEGLQARPVLQLARQLRPDIQLAYTFFSPSAEAFSRGLDVDFTDYLPFDTAEDARRALGALTPSVLVFSKLDLWPMLCAEADALGVALALISGTVSAASSRRGGVATALLRDAYGRLDAAGAISDDDAARLLALGAPRDVVSVTGDTRYDQVWERAQRVDRSSPLLAPLASERPTMVAGSTWPADEAVLLSAWLDVRRAVPTARLIIAPHEPNEAHLAPIERWGRENSLSLARLGTIEASGADVVLVERVGVLGDLYSLATAAYVGGGFHDAGLHSVLEPAAFGAPVAFGPRNRNSRDAALLEEHDGGATVRNRHDVDDVFTRWLGNISAARAAGDNARALVAQGRGGAERSWSLIERLLPSPTARPRNS
ncbi:MAG: glycosyltransferase N-terminal domain-containing protein [Gemmatimonadaceae bacterium]